MKLSYTCQRDLSFTHETALVKHAHLLHLRRSHQYIVPSPLPALSAVKLNYLKDFNAVFFRIFIALCSFLEDSEVHPEHDGAVVTDLYCLALYVY